MSDQTRLRRSLLYMPGSNTRALEKGRSLPADGLILDLEDAVAPDSKEQARAQVMAAIAAGGYGGGKSSSASTASTRPGAQRTSRPLRRAPPPASSCPRWKAPRWCGRRRMD